ncbi:MAG: type IV toxin-antitoxin system AbiEi family antitoxin [Deltaproteobacteria bacterium]|nr:type IV toxin-antitoxin system AbiEi family antitoxin [Deltaproteobacteria bacterium]
MQQKIEQFGKIRYWIEALPKVGKTTFSLEEVFAVFPNTPRQNLHNTLHRLVLSGKIKSVWKGFYAIVLYEFGIEGNIPHTEYIDQLMKYLGVDYYIALLSAAALYGASQQQPQTFMVVCNKELRAKVKDGSKLEFAEKKIIPQKYVNQKVVNSGTINVSTPELTAVDLLLYNKLAGGLLHVVTVLDELAEKIDFNKIEKDFFDNIPVAVIQRLGYIFDNVLNEHNIANVLLEKSKQAKIIFRKIPLVAMGQEVSSKETYFVDPKWKIIINYKIEADI